MCRSDSSDSVERRTLHGDRFGGDGKKTFGLPDMRGHEPIKGLSYLIATAGIYPSRKAVSVPNQYGIPPLLGQLLLVAYVPKYTPPAGWATFDGQLLKIDREVALYTLLGTKFGGDGKTTFALPDLRGHQPMKGISYVISRQVPNRELSRVEPSKMGLCSAIRLQFK